MIQLLEIRALAAPNVWGTVPMLECRLAYDPIPTVPLKELFRKLEPWRPQTVPIEQLGASDTVQAFLDLVLAVQRAAGCRVSLGHVQPSAYARLWELVFEIEDESTGRAALEAACRLLIMSANADESLKLDELIAPVRAAAERHQCGETTRLVLEATRRRNLPVYRLDESNLLQLGQGWKQRRIRKSATDQTGVLADSISQDKWLTKSLLEKAGLPVATGRRVMDANDACRAAKEIHAAVVVKPCDADYGDGVTVNLTDDTALRRAYDLARLFSNNILVERYLSGYWHRFLVVNGCLVAAVRKEPPQVLGDGRQTISALIDTLNADPRRGESDHQPMTPLTLGATELGMLYQQGYHLNSIPEAGTVVRLRPDAYLYRGATQTDVTDLVHPELAELAVTAAEIIGLDVAGVDLICDDASFSVSEQQVGVLEVNSEPAIFLHMAPVSQPARPVTDRILEMLFPAGDNGRIPVILVLGDPDLAEHLDRYLRKKGMSVGLVTKNQALLNGRKLGSASGSMRLAAEKLWMQRKLEFVVIDLNLTDVLVEGMPVDQCDVLCLTISKDAPQAAFEKQLSEAELSRVLKLLLEGNFPATDILVNLDASGWQTISWPTTHCLLVSRDGEQASLRQHRANGGRSLIFDDHQIMLLTAEGNYPMMPVSVKTPVLYHMAVTTWMDHFFLKSDSSKSPSNSPSRAIA